MVRIDPEAFLGDVPCAPEPGALQTYVATLFDMTPSASGGTAGELEPIRLPSSPPASCRQSVVFGPPPNPAAELPVIIPGHSYAAYIEAYARADLVQPELGVSTLVDPESESPVEPDWITDCGQTPLYEGSAPPESALRVTAIYQETALVFGCDPLFHLGPETPTVVTVGLGLEPCEEAGVERYVVRHQGEELAAACGESVELPGVEPDEFVEVELLAFPSSSDAPTHGTTCNARALLGARVSAQCDTLASEGSIRVDVASVRAALGDPSCTELGEILVTLEGSSESDAASLAFDAGVCRGSARFAPVAPGEHVLQASAGGRARTNCSASVEPGLSAPAQCEAAEE